MIINTNSQTHTYIYQTPMFQNKMALIVIIKLLCIFHADYYFILCIFYNITRHVCTIESHPVAMFFMLIITSYYVYSIHHTQCIHTNKSHTVKMFMYVYAKR